MAEKRVYRTGNKHRNGNVDNKTVASTFGFKSVKFTKNFNGGDKVKVLNNAYDGLMDLRDIMGVSPLFISLLGEENTGINLYFSENRSIPYSMVIDSTNNYAIRWFNALNRTLGRLQNLKTGIIEGKNEVSPIANAELLLLLDSIKTKEVTSVSFDNDAMKKVLDELFALLEEIPVLNKETIDEKISMQNTVVRFKRELTVEKFNEMMDALSEYIEKYGVALGDLKVKLQEYFNELNTLSKENQIENTEVIKVETDYIKKLREFNLGDDLLASSLIFELYIYLKGKDIGISNNYLCGDNDHKSYLYPSNEERNNMISAMEMFITSIKAKYTDVFENKDAIEKVDSNSTNLSNNSNDIIESIINSDKEKGKFKITLFKELCKDKGLSIDVPNIIHSNGTYSIPFNDDTLKKIEVDDYNDISGIHNAIDIFLDDNETEAQYYWTNELNYKRLVDELAKYCKKKIKFPLTEFKKGCREEGLRALLDESPIINDTYEIKFVGGYITHVYSPIKSSKDIKYSIKTVRETIPFVQHNEFNIKELILLLTVIEKKGNEAYIKDYERTQKERDNFIEKYKDTNKEYEKIKKYNEIKKENNKCLKYSIMKEEDKSIDSSSTNNELSKNYLSEDNITDLKDLRTILYKYTTQEPRLQYLTGRAISVYSRLTYNINMYCKVTYPLILATVPKEKGMGNAKNWMIDEKTNIITVSSSGLERKCIEGIIESFVTIALRHHPTYVGSDGKMLIESVTYMICRKLGLDVRTYCISKDFEHLIESGNLSLFITKSKRLYDRYIKYFS